MAKKAVLLINGEIDIAFCESYICQHLDDLPIYCADGAFNQIQNVKSLVNKVRMIIGDGDSIDHAKRLNIPYQQDDDQYSTDFEKALNHLRQHGYRELFLFGFGGREMDHYLGNISTLLRHQYQLKCQVIDRYGVSQLMHQKMCISNAKGKMVSIVPLFELIDLTLQGFAFDLDQYTLRFGEELGIRNHALQDELFIDYSQGDGLLFLSHDPYHRFLSK
ncbi:MULTISPECIES: thiamine diphosphokinase [Cysteiniphilum]|uniref:Thiamine diphosphokinase n=1 Tax=Cysteiniphilum litorale TaxID=2056700 RepID=A0A8J2Z591_9GAMM|nr:MULTISPECIES: thiamine diphosphokinase [Cysteiniphilum]GGG00658.1 thiamine pyrophosphokinase [Cysteiniphilum litorale]